MFYCNKLIITFIMRFCTVVFPMTLEQHQAIISLSPAPSPAPALSPAPAPAPALPDKEVNALNGLLEMSKFSVGFSHPIFQKNDCYSSKFPIRCNCGMKNASVCRVTEISKQYRCGFKSLVEEFEKMKLNIKNEHRTLWRKTPFRLIFDALGEERLIAPKRMNTHVYEDLLNSYVKGKGQFKFGSNKYKPDVIDVKLIFGIEDGEEDVGHNAMHGRLGSDFGPRMFGKVTRISGKMIKDRLMEAVKKTDEESIKDTVRLMCLLLFQTVFFATTGQFIGWGYMHYVDDLERLSYYNWSEHILNELQKALEKSWDHPSKVNGCIVFLPYWFCEHYSRAETIYGKEKEGADDDGNNPSAIRGIPRMTKWRLETLRRYITAATLKAINPGNFNDKPLKPTKTEISLLPSLKRKQKATEFLYVPDSDFEESGKPQRIAIRTLRKETRYRKTATKTVQKEDGPKFKNSLKGSSSKASVNEKTPKDGPSFELFPDGVYDVPVVAGSRTLVQPETGGTSYQASEEVNIPEIETDNESEKADQPNQSDMIKIAESHKTEVKNLIVKLLNERIEEVRKMETTLSEIKKENKKLALELQKMDTERIKLQVFSDQKVAQIHTMQERIENLKATKKRLAEKIKMIEQNNAELIQIMKGKSQVVEETPTTVSGQPIEPLRSVKPVTRSAIKVGVDSEKEISNLRATLYSLELTTKKQEDMMVVYRGCIELKNRRIVELEKELELKATKLEQANYEIINESVHAVTQMFVEKVEEEDGKPKQGSESCVAGRLKKDPRKRKKSRNDQYEYEDVRKKKRLEEVDITTDDDDVNEVDVLKIMKPDKKSYKCGKYVEAEAYERIKAACQDGGGLATVWMRPGKRCGCVNVYSMMKILDCQYIDSSVLDGFAELMQETRWLKKNLHFITAECWAQCLDYEKRKVYDNALVHMVLDRVREGKELFFPLCCPGRHPEPYHWVLLTFNPQDSTWKMYNPMGTRLVETDPFLKDCKKMIKYLRKSMKNIGGNEILGDAGSAVIRISDITQQGVDTTDCAVYVMYYMTRLGSDNDIPKIWTNDAVQMFKASMVNSFALDKKLLLL